MNKPTLFAHYHHDHGDVQFKSEEEILEALLKAKTYKAEQAAKKKEAENQNNNNN